MWQYGPYSWIVVKPLDYFGVRLTVIRTSISLFMAISRYWLIWINISTEWWPSMYCARLQSIDRNVVNGSGMHLIYILDIKRQTVRSKWLGQWRIIHMLWLDFSMILWGFSMEFLTILDNNPTLIDVMAWRRPGDKPLPEPLLAQFTDAYMQH